MTTTSCSWRITAARCPAWTIGLVSYAARVPVIGFLHTSPTHRAPFDALVAELGPGIETAVVVDEELLSQARQLGFDHRQVQAGIADALQELERLDAVVVVCTCSTIGQQAEVVGRKRNQRVLRVDRPMAEAAVAIGSRIAVVAALESTIGPTRALIEDVAQDRRIQVDVSTVLDEQAWGLFESGHRAEYLQAIARTCESIDDSVDVIVLAQASMAEAINSLTTKTPVLVSPRLAVAAAVALVR
jgi:Asp/Glu/hydantoin racemase